MEYLIFSDLLLQGNPDTTGYVVASAEPGGVAGPAGGVLTLPRGHHRLGGHVPWPQGPDPDLGAGSVSQLPAARGTLSWGY